MPQFSSGLSRILLAFAAGGISLMAMAHSTAALTPQQVAVIINGNNPNSWNIARYYAQERHIPKINLIVLSGLPHDDVQIPVDMYDIHVSAAIRRILRQRHLKKIIRCLVTTWGIPLRVAGMGTSPQINLEIQQIQQGLHRQIVQLTRGITQLNALAATSPVANAVTGPVPPDGQGPVTQAAQLALQHFGQALNNAIHRVGLLPPVRRQTAFAKLLSILTVYIGPGGVSQTIHIHGSSAVAQKDHHTLAAMHKDVQKELPEIIRLSQRRYLEKNRLKLRQLQLKLFGVVGLTRQLLSDTVYLQQSHGHTAVLQNEKCATPQQPVILAVRILAMQTTGVEVCHTTQPHFLNAYGSANHIPHQLRRGAVQSADHQGNVRLQLANTTRPVRHVHGVVFHSHGGIGLVPQRH